MEEREDKYLVVVYYELEEVQHAVNDALELGYKLYGELTYADGRWYQVVTWK